MKSVFQFLIILPCLISCSSDRDLLIEKFHELNLEIHKGKFDCLVNEMDSMSTAFLDEVTDPDNMNYEAMKRIGHKYKLRILTLQYFHQMRDHPDKIRRELNYFRFLSLNHVPWFDIDGIYTIVQDKIKMEERKYVPISNKVFDRNYLYWLGFRQNALGEFEFDLMYSLVLFETKLKRRYVPGIKKLVPKFTPDEMVDALWAQWELEPFEPYNFESIDFNRRSPEE